jgi:PAS domain S-box-containing protein
MANRCDLFEAVLDALTEGVAVADMEGRVAFWNRSAEAITGHPSSELVGQPAQEALESLIVAGSRVPFVQPLTPPAQNRDALVHARHRHGHVLAVLAKGLVLRDGLGKRIGTGVIFRPLATADALPHALSGESRAEEDQAEFADRLAVLQEDCLRGGIPLGVLWITVDQSRELRGTHGAGACEAMLERVQRVLFAGLTVTEEIGRWGDDDFLVLSRIQSVSSLAARAQALEKLAGTADFRWWGDRVSISVTVGMALAKRGEPVSQWLERARFAMAASAPAGDSQDASADGRHA